MFRKISYLGFNLQRKEDERWKEFRNKGYFVSGIFPIVPPVPFVSSGARVTEGRRDPGMKPYNMACRVAQEGFIPWERLYGCMR